MEKNPRLTKYKENDVILHEGETKNEMYKIVSGKVIVYFNYGKEEEYLIGILSEQRCFGESCLLCHSPSSYTYVAMDDVLLMSIPESEFDSFLKSNHLNAKNIILNLARENSTMKCNIEMLMEELTECKIAANTGNIHHLRSRMIHHAVNEYQKSLLFEKKL